MTPLDESKNSPVADVLLWQFSNTKDLSRFWTVRSPVRPTGSRQTHPALAVAVRSPWPRGP